RPKPSGPRARCAMSQLPFDHNALLGLLAVRNELLTAEALAEAVRAWEHDPNGPFGPFLVARGLLEASELDLLEALVEVCLKRQTQEIPVEGTLRTKVGAGSATRSPASGGREPPRGRLGGLTPPSPVGGSSRYRVLRSHARGGLGEVFVALDEELQREVALKEIKSQHADNTSSRQRFLLEAEVTGRLEHPGIVPVYGLGGYPDGRPYYAMRFIRGESLSTAIERFHEMSPADASAAGLELRRLLRHFLDVCNAIAFAHSRGVLHRDLKPDNVMLGEFGETLIVDWGLAKAGVQ